MENTLAEWISLTDTILQEALDAINAANHSKDLNDIKVQFTGKKGKLNQISQQMGKLSKDEKPQLGQAISNFNKNFSQAFNLRTQEIHQKELNEKLAAETIDVTLPGTHHPMGTRHLLTQTREHIEDFFISLGYQVIEGPQVEEDRYNFEKMNLPKDHPARDMQDTFYIDDETLLRTHTSPVQARTLEVHDFSQGDLKMISPGNVFRRDEDDATHSHQFQQIEGLVVGQGINLSHLKGTLLVFSQAMFGPETDIRLRPSYFPFTEPSVEVDVTCFKCHGQGCNMCKGTGWIEILGAGLVHPRVLEMSGIDADVYSGFAFGLGIERVAMLRHGVDDIRYFYQNDLRFLHQFKGGQV